MHYTVYGTTNNPVNLIAAAGTFQCHPSFIIECTSFVLRDNASILHEGDE